MLMSSPYSLEDYGIDTKHRLMISSANSYQPYNNDNTGNDNHNNHNNSSRGGDGSNTNDCGHIAQVQSFIVPVHHHNIRPSQVFATFFIRRFILSTVCLVALYAFSIGFNESIHVYPLDHSKVVMDYDQAQCTSTSVSCSTLDCRIDFVYNNTKDTCHSSKIVAPAPINIVYQRWIPYLLFYWTLLSTDLLNCLLLLTRTKLYVDSNLFYSLYRYIVFCGRNAQPQSCTAHLMTTLLRVLLFVVYLVVLFVSTAVVSILPIAELYYVMVLLRLVCSKCAFRSNDWHMSVLRYAHYLSYFGRAYWLFQDYVWVGMGVALNDEATFKCEEQLPFSRWLLMMTMKTILFVGSFDFFSRSRSIISAKNKQEQGVRAVMPFGTLDYFSYKINHDKYATEAVEISGPVCRNKMEELNAMASDAFN